MDATNPTALDVMVETLPDDGLLPAFYRRVAFVAWLTGSAELEVLAKRLAGKLLKEIASDRDASVGEIKEISQQVNQKLHAEVMRATREDACGPEPAPVAVKGLGDSIGAVATVLDRTNEHVRVLVVDGDSARRAEVARLFANHRCIVETAGWRITAAVSARGTKPELVCVGLGRDWDADAGGRDVCVPWLGDVETIAYTSADVAMGDVLWRRGARLIALGVRSSPDHGGIFRTGSVSLAILEDGLFELSGLDERRRPVVREVLRGGTLEAIAERAMVRVATVTRTIGELLDGLGVQPPGRTFERALRALHDEIERRRGRARDAESALVDAAKELRSAPLRSAPLARIAPPTRAMIPEGRGLS